MKKLIFIISIFLGLNLFGMNQIDKKVLGKIPLFEQPGIKIKKVIDANSLYIVQVEFANGAIDTAFLTKDKKYLFTGDAINTNDGAKLTIPIDMSILKGKEAFTFGKGEKELVLFTDTQCPYCKKFESYFRQIEDKVKIHVFFFPLAHHTEAFDLSVYIMSQNSLKEQINTFLKTSADDVGFKNRKIPKDKEKILAQKVNEQIMLGKEIGVQGTPTLLDIDGNKVSWVQLLKEYGIQIR